MRYGGRGEKRGKEKGSRRLIFIAGGERGSGNGASTQRIVLAR